MTPSTDTAVRRLFAPLILALALINSPSAASAAEPSPSSSEANTMKIRLTINGQSATATLDDNPTARDFLSMLPLALTLEDYASTEKIAYPPRKLSTQGAPAGIDPEIGDITYYAPWGNLALFYKDFGYSAGLIRLGRLDTGVEALSVRGSLKVTIEATGQ
mgnify:CR=1 FL=1|jgi:hypothetical protein